VAALSALAAQGDVKAEVVTDAIRRYDIDANSAEPTRR
jgi:pyruvate dehydrogenase complex dehydrogenase (E1) component